MVPTELEGLIERNRSNAVVAFVALCRRGAHIRPIPVIYAQLGRELHMQPITLRRALMTLEAHGYARHRTRTGRAIWRCYVTPRKGQPNA